MNRSPPQHTYISLKKLSHNSFKEADILTRTQTQSKGKDNFAKTTKATTLM